MRGDDIECGYHGLRFAANGRDPEVLYMRASKERGGEPHLRLHVEYSVVDSDPVVLPAEDLVEAAMRVAELAAERRGRGVVAIGIPVIADAAVRFGDGRRRRSVGR